MAFDPNVDYQALINKAKQDGDAEAAAKYEQQRNEKIAAMDKSGTNTGGYTPTYNYQNGNSGGSNYTPINVNKAPGVNYGGYLEEVEKQKEYMSQYPGMENGADINELYKQYGSVVDGTLMGFSGNSANGFYTDDPALIKRAEEMGYVFTPTKYNGKEGYYYTEGIKRPSQEGTSGADEALLSDGSYAIIQQLKAEYDAAKQRGDTAGMERAHAMAEAIRANQGYTGGADGSQYITLGKLGYGKDDGYGGDAGGGSGSGSYGGVTSQDWIDQLLGAGIGTGTGLKATEKVTLDPNDYLKDINTDLSGQFTRYDPAELKSYLEEWKKAAQAQAEGKIDFGVQQAVTELERALEDAQPKFKEQAEFIAKEERQDLDNSALYAEARGDKGGIGQAQYNEIQAAAAKNQLAVQQAQTKLATDTQRQIADLRAQGEFEKADAALEISQTYLSQLMSLEQWAAEYDLSYDQFQAALRQWAAEYEMAMAQFKVGVDQWNAEYGLAVDQFNTSKDQWSSEFDLALKQFEAGLRQWESEFGLAEKQFQTGVDQWNQQFQAGLDQWNKEFGLAQNQFQVDTDLAYGQLMGTLPSTGGLTLSGQKQLASMGEAMLSAGIMPSSQQLSAMGMTEAQAQQYLTALRLEEAAAAVKSSSGGSKNSVSMDYDGLFEAAEASGHPQSFISNNYKKYGFTSSTGLYNDYKSWAEAEEKVENTVVRPSIGYITDGSGAPATESAGSASAYGTRYNDVLSTARQMKSSGKSEAAIEKYLDGLSETELTDAGLARIMALLDLYGYGGV